MLPKLPRLWRQQGLSDVDQFLNQRCGLRTKGAFDPARCAEEIGYHRVFASLHFREEQGRSRLSDYTAMNLRDFEVRINFSVDGNEIVFAAKQVKEGAQIRMHQRRAIA